MVWSANEGPDLKPTGRFTWGAHIPMRDGIRLNATVYRPYHQAQPLPVVFQLTPYHVDTFYSDGAFYAQRGYVVVWVDVRGRGDSEGEYTQVIHDGLDGSDCIAWIAQQPWCDGRVVMNGSSYAGTNQWLIAHQRPPALKTITPAAISLLGYDYPNPGGALSAFIFWVMTFTAGRGFYTNLMADGPVWNAHLAEIFKGNRQLSDLAELTGYPAPLFAKMASMERPHEAYRGCIFGPQEYAQIDIPVLNLTGLADLCAAGTIEVHRRSRQHGGPTTQEHNYLLIGPWEHLGLDGSDQVGELRYAPQAKLDLRGLKAQWFDWVLGRGARPEFLGNKVTYYLTGAETWKSAASLEALSQGERCWYLHSSGGASDLFHSGYLLAEPQDGPADHFICDPNNFEVVAVELLPRSFEPPKKENASSIRVARPYNDLSTVLSGTDPTNDIFARHLGDWGLVYHSAPLERDLSVVGHPRLSLWLSLDAPDADLAFMVWEVLPEGASIFLSSDFIRLRFRDSLDTPTLLTPGEPFLLERNRMWFAARTLRKGSRLRLVIRSGATLRRQKNLNTATPIPFQRPEEARAATVTVFHDLRRPAMLALPLEA